MVSEGAKGQAWKLRPHVHEMTESRSIVLDQRRGKSKVTKMRDLRGDPNTFLYHSLAMHELS